MIHWLTNEHTLANSAGLSIFEHPAPAVYITVCFSCKAAAQIDHFTVACLVACPLNESEAGIDLVLLESSLLFLC